MKNIGILGGSSFIGFHLCKSALAAGHEVHAFNRGITVPPENLPGVHLTRGARERKEDLAAFFKTRFDFVFDLSGYNPHHVRPILEKYRSNIGHYLFCSTIVASEQDVPVPGTYGGDKALCENLLFDASREHGLPVTVLRLQGVIGAYGLAQEMQVFFRLKNGFPILMSPGQFARINFLAVTDLVRVFFAAAGNSAAFGKTYNVAGDEVTSLRDFVNLCGKAAAIKPGFREVASQSFRGRFGRVYNVGVGWPHKDYITANTLVKNDLAFEFTSLEDVLFKTWRETKTNPRLLPAGLPQGEEYVLRNEAIPCGKQLYWKLKEFSATAILKRRLLKYRPALKKVRQILGSISP